ncbi:MAG: PilN domain-containing protein [Elusimicrobiota bacterium]
MIKVNLVPGEILAKARQRQLLLQAGLVGGVFGIVLVLIALMHWAGLYRLQNDFKYKQSKLQELQPIVSQVEDLEKESEAVKARLGVIEGLLKGRAFYPLFMSEFARTVPSGVKITALNTASQPDAVKLSITATADTSDDVAGWMRTLEKNSHFSGVDLGPVSAAGQKYSFTITTLYTLKL